MGRRALKQAVFLDRDGVLNTAVVRDGKPYPPASVAELEINPEAKSSLDALHQAGFLLVVVTNQPDVARGTQAKEEVEAIHEVLKAALPLDAVYACFHDGPDQCNCRKPKSGLLLNAAQDLDIDLKTSFIIGDRWRDVEAGAGAGCRTVFLDFHYAERQPESPSVTVTCLRDGVAWILAQAE